MLREERADFAQFIETDSVLSSEDGQCAEAYNIAKRIQPAVRTSWLIIDVTRTEDFCSLPIPKDPRGESGKTLHVLRREGEERGHGELQRTFGQPRSMGTMTEVACARQGAV